jgi:hypothetical protein
VRGMIRVHKDSEIGCTLLYCAVLCCTPIIRLLAVSMFITVSCQSCDGRYFTETLQASIGIDNRQIYNIHNGMASIRTIKQ